MNQVVVRSLVATVVALHLFGNLWHGDAHTTLEIALPGAKLAFVVVVILAAPVLGAVLSWTRYSAIGLWIVGLAMVGSVVFSVYHHYVLISIDNVEHLPAGTPQAHAHFADSAALIAIVALAGALLAFYAAGRAPRKANADPSTE
jgi:hypothetical protein